MGTGVTGPVLVVEDDASIRQLLREAFEQDGLECIAVVDGDEALRLVESRKPAVVVLDLGLPLIDGAGVADGIRERYGDTVPIIVVTASRRLEDAAAQIPAFAYVAKPFDIGDLVAVVRRALDPPPDTALVESPAPSPAS